MNLHVVLDIFSGLPNPQWQLGVEQSLVMVSLLSGLASAAPDEIPPRPDLGYRGFEISNFEGSCSTYRVFRGYVDACGTITHDPDMQTELWLLKSGEQELEPGFYAELLTEIDQK